MKYVWNRASNHLIYIPVGFKMLSVNGCNSLSRSASESNKLSTRTVEPSTDTATSQLVTGEEKMDKERESLTVFPKCSHPLYTDEFKLFPYVHGYTYTTYNV